MEVRVRKGRDGKPDVNGAIRVLKKKLMREGFFQELRRRESFIFPRFGFPIFRPGR